MFDIHGELDLTLDENIIIVTLIGSFNEAGVKDWTQKVKKLIEELTLAPFFILMNNTDYEGFTPEASDISNDFNLWLNEQAMVAKAIVQPSLLARKMSLKNIPALEKQRIEYFDTKSDALLWLKALPEYFNSPQ